MTMIASIINGVSPILISDLLVSSSHKPEEMRIPAVSDNLIKYLPEASGLYPFGFNQKVYILKENVCVAFSGKVLYFKKFLEDLKIFCKIYDSVDVDKLSLFLTEKKDETWEEFSFIIHLIVDYEQPTGIVRYVHGIGHHKETDMFGEIHSSGSGSEDFIIESLTQGKLQADESNEYLRTIQVNSILICRLLCREWLSLYTVANLWGGGFELVYVNGGRFCKADRMTYVINHEKFDADGKLPFPKPQVIFHYRYYEDVLVITVVRAAGGEIEHSEEYHIIRSSKVHFEQFFVYPIDNYPTDKKDKVESDGSFSSTAVAMGYVFEKGNMKFIPASFHNGPDLLVEYVHENGITIKMKKHVNDLLVKAAEEAFPSL